MATGSFNKTVMSNTIWSNVGRESIRFVSEVMCITRDVIDKLEGGQLKVARFALGLPTFALSEAVLAELGWATVKHRMDLALLRYYARLSTLPRNRQPARA